MDKKHAAIALCTLALLFSAACTRAADSRLDNAGTIIHTEPLDSAAAGHARREPPGHHHGRGGSGSDKLPAGTAYAQFRFGDGSPEAGANERLTIRICEKDGKSIEAYDIHHEKMMHLIVVSEDLSYFEHLHPEYKGSGEFQADLAFPSGGRFKLFADVVPKGSEAKTFSEWVEVQGKASAVPLLPDASLVKKLAGKKITLDLAHLSVRSGTELTFTISDAESGKPIDDLEPYLGAVGHVVILSADLDHYLHAHTSDGSRLGPKATFHASFPAPGIYKLWAQFKHRGEVFTVPFVLNVPK